MGSETTYKNFWKPSYATTSRSSWTSFNTYLDYLDARLGVNVKAHEATGDGSTDDSTAVQAAIDSITAGNVYFPPGTYKIGNITMKAGVNLIGHGRASKLIPTNGTTANIFTFGNNDSNITLAYLYFYGDGTDTLGTYGSAVYISAGAGYECENLRIINCEFESFSDSGIRCADGLKKSWIIDNLFHDNIDGGIGSADINMLGTVSDVTIRGNQCLSANDTGIRVIPTGEIRKLRIVENTSIGHDEKGIAIYDVSGTAGTLDIVVAHNHAEDNDARGIDINMKSTDTITGMVVFDSNTLYNNASDSPAGAQIAQMGVINTAVPVIVTNNIFRDVQNNSNPHLFISGADNVLVKGNQFHESTATVWAIRSGVVNTKVSIRDNQCYGHQFLYLSASDETQDVIVENNSVFECGAYGIWISLQDNDTVGRVRVANNHLHAAAGNSGEGIRLNSPNTAAVDWYASIKGNDIYSFADAIRVGNNDSDMEGVISDNYIVDCTDGVVMDKVDDIVAQNNVFFGVTNRYRWLNSPAGVIMVEYNNAGWWEVLHDRDGTRRTVRFTFGTAAPAAGTWSQGDICYNTGAAAGGAPGWVCTSAGSPGTWKAMANLAA